MTFDMLSWMMMDPALASKYHLSGNANPLYTFNDPANNRFFWTKGSTGLPWDVQLYDNNYIYQSVTEVSWTDPTNYKIFNSPVYGLFGQPMCPRIAEPGRLILNNPDSSYELHTSCSAFTVKTVGTTKFTLSGPTPMDMGFGSLPTLTLSYFWGGDPTFTTFGHREDYFLQQPFGLVKWQHTTLPGTTPDNVSNFNKLTLGTVTPVHPCF